VNDDLGMNGRDQEMILILLPHSALVCDTEKIQLVVAGSNDGGIRHVG
jgi:hypothetical protein